MPHKHLLKYLTDTIANNREKLSRCKYVSIYYKIESYSFPRSIRLRNLCKAW